MKKGIIFLILGIAVLAALFMWQAGIFGGGKNNNNNLPEGITIFFGEGCAYCKVLDEFIEENKIAEKVDFRKLEVWSNKNNQDLLVKAAQKCGLGSTAVGIPFIFDGEKCYIGSDEGISFFKQKAGIQ